MLKIKDEKNGFPDISPNLPNVKIPENCCTECFFTEETFPESILPKNVLPNDFLPKIFLPT